MAVSLDSRLTLTVRALARLWAQGQLTPDQLRQQMRPALANAHTVAMLAGTGGQRNREIDTALREIIEAEWAELDRLIELLESQPETDIERRLLAFSTGLIATRNDGVLLVSRDDASPLIPAVVGGALGTLLAQLASRPNEEILLPRADRWYIAPTARRIQTGMDALSDLYNNGELLLDDWHERMRRAVTEAHTRYYQIGKGTALTDADRSFLAGRVRIQLAFLDEFRRDIEAGKLTPAQIKARARMYMTVAESSLHEGAGTAIGLPRLPAHPKDGSTDCKHNCRCWGWVIRPLPGNGNFDVYWKMTPADHCEQCPERERLWNPIEIRNGVLGPYSRVGTFA